MKLEQKDEMLLDTVSLIIKLIGFHDHATGERYQKMCQTIFTILMYCVDFKTLGVSDSSDFLDSTFGALKAMVFQSLSEKEEPSPTEQ